MSRRRWAVYWTPEPAHPLWQAGCEWLGRDPAHTQRFGAAPPDREAPWRYGFHATLKAPMALRDDVSAAHFLSAVRALAVRTEPFGMPALKVSWLANFLALCPTEPLDAAHPLHRLADDCVRELDGWRAAPGVDEAQRHRGEFDDEQRALLDRWGYPHVFSRWRFHMTLSDPIPAQDTQRRERLEQAAMAHFGATLAAPLQARSLSVFLEERMGAPLQLTHRLAFAAA